ncbi:glycerol-3-phosphate dehydrogenase [Nematocida parisii]|uniref:glycerol-3-phosphate dehydrogenase n=1 Tax=Nematocida parisii (strain ERTm3) TaxID=935791 RepID=I3EIG3_NEMP3|nr:anaerobic glycerol-3-phosphate dehydrogenase [Nematocida parisii ERTm1]EIJ89010.1 anaerobic glycerol-3-phosphate dehydrogenase [Nematocida parisii ERTm3]KAI5126514.1 glycerol-3-phosphate dehydrogenase [Nematocida parisii]EIJ93436.1 anaerobic glycerol-3-phosphate dehydrogenase [Nematocida parisii ERTm1]KAI5128264.1 glycerol-3-phosphate dehydrogenase [Nematocida parisii]KAI5140043.1 glycerol-3-phosphate dehydrogenase [Nematocida parisii]|eukprot:XP_013059606.1 anaerobic glycerol-3-phosphate dehydrogenase [Nematocida parisii ERTm1]
MGIIRSACITALTGAVILEHILMKEDERKYKQKYNKSTPMNWMPPSRSTTINNITNIKYDLVIIGGGSAGAGCLLDAASRGYSALLLEREDFASGTSSKSTKLIHGGIRYLEKAIKELDYKQLSLVIEGLRERKSFLNLAPYLTREVGILLPIRHTITIPYFWLGTKVYDWLSGSLGVQKSYFINKKEVKRVLPTIDYKKVAGGMVYFDGQMDDSRVNTMLIETAIYHEGTALNYCEVIGFKKSKGKIVGVTFQDKETGRQHTVECTGVINATGPFTDKIRQLDNPETPKIISPSVGVHLVIPGGYTGKFGMLNPSTKNGSVLFLLPWRKHSILGTTDSTGTNTMPAEKDVNYLINEMGEFVERKLIPKAKNILSAWGGIRPLAMDPSAGMDSTAIVRSHLIDKSESGLLTISGGKWTSYREMAEEAVTEAARTFRLPHKKCITKYIRLIGSHEYHVNMPTYLSKTFGIPQDISEHLVSTYGDRARKVCEYANGNYTRIDVNHPYITAEVPYTIDHEHVRRISDYLGRRSLFAYFNVRDAHSSVPVLLKEFKQYMNWSEDQARIEERQAYAYLDTMGYSLLKKMEDREIKFEEFKAAVLGTCKNSLCDYNKVNSLVKKSFNLPFIPALKNSQVHKKSGTVPIQEVLSTVQNHFSIIQ